MVEDIIGEMAFTERWAKMSPADRERLTAQQLYKNATILSKLPCVTGNECYPPRSFIQRNKPTLGQVGVTGVLVAVAEVILKVFGK